MTAYGLRWQSIVDFVVLAPSIYLLLRWSRDARALRATIGILGLEVGALVAGQLALVITVWVLHAAAVSAGVVLIVLFQPQLRHALNTLEVVLKRSERRGALSQALEIVSAAAFSLAGAGRGALLVLTRGSSWALDSMEGALLTARADIHTLSDGVHKIGLRVPGPLPPGVTVAAIDPERITFRLRPVKDAGVTSKPGP
jgi:DNA integrity scanning protein DisA with diadenylate cyclase activity